MNHRTSKASRRYMIRLGLPILLIIMFLCTILSTSVAAQSQEVRVFIIGPDVLPINVSFEYTVRIIGGPADNLGVNETANWSYSAGLGVLKPPGASVTPEESNSTENVFLINVTASDSPTKLSLEVNGTSSNGTQTNWSGAVFKEIEVFKPITVNITAVVRNPSDIDVRDAVISFYVDGKMVGNLTEGISANSTKEVYWEWIASKDDKGEHEVEVWINEDGKLLEFNNGDNVLRKTIYLGQRPERKWGPIMIFNSGLGFIIGAIAFVFVFMAVLMWRATKRGRGYYSPGSSYSMYFVGIFSMVLSVPIIAVSQILAENPEVAGDSTGKFIEGLVIFIMGFLIILLTWDRTRGRKK
jgi:hypothetical protein